jgi:signal transduction histidine kinase
MTSPPAPPPLSSSDNPQYVEVMRDLITTNAPGWIAISLLAMLSVWGDWTKVAIIVGAELFLVPFNVYVTLRLNPQLGPTRAELLRAAVDLAGTVAVAMATDWPLPLWFRLIFVALAFDQLSRRTAIGTLVTFALVCDVVAVLDGVSWTIPLFFTAMAAYCSRVSQVRTRAIRRMLERSDGQRRDLEAAHDALRDANTQLVAEMATRAEMELELRQAQKLEAVGRLAAGIAHEINTPTQFVGDNVQFSRDACRDLLGLLDVYRAALAAAGRRELPAADVARAEEEADLPYLREHLPRSFDQTLEGIGRIAAIVRSVKTFAHPSHHELAPVDLNEAVRSTLTIARSSYKDVAEVETDLGDLPAVTCNGGEINQVILNLIVNAADAIAAAGRGRRGRITVRTRASAGEVVISIGDDGTGVPAQVQDRVFDPFFTTKEVGRGTGQGLAIASRVAHKHGGSLTFTTELGVGTTFTLRLPTTAAPSALAA